MIPAVAVVVVGLEATIFKAFQFNPYCSVVEAWCEWLADCLTNRERETERERERGFSIKNSPFWIPFNALFCFWFLHSQDFSLLSLSSLSVLSFYPPLRFLLSVQSYKQFPRLQSREKFAVNLWYITEWWISVGLPWFIR